VLVSLGVGKFWVNVSNLAKFFTQGTFTLINLAKPHDLELALFPFQKSLYSKS
jgi:hypothetical protein